MNLRLVIHQLGTLLLGLAAAMAVVTLLHVAGLFGDSHAERMAYYALLIAVACTAALGGVLWIATRRADTSLFNRRDALLLVAGLWMIGAPMAAIPYYAWAKLGGPPAPPPSITIELAEELDAQPLAVTSPPEHVFVGFSACYFEAMSGLSTTGATVLGGAPFDIESLPRGLLLWRALTHWLGGLGIVVLFVAVLPMVGMGGKRLFKLEAPSPTNTGVRPRVKETARVLWLIYFGLTLAQITALGVAGMPWFDAVCHSFSVLATGGLSTKNASLGAYYHNPAIDLITIVFMILAAINFGLYYQLINRNWRSVVRDPELRVFLVIVALATLVITFWIWGDAVVITTGETVESESFVAALRDSLFQVVAIQTGTGYCTIDFELWPFGTKAILVTLMFFGGMAGSTTGGLKIVRVIVLYKIIRAEFERVFRPQVVNPIRVGGNALDPEIVRSVPIYLLMVLLIFGLGSVTLMLIEPEGSISYATAASATISTLMNVGPGVAGVGATDNYGFFSGPSLVLLALLMALGRLELFALLVLLAPRFWVEK